MKDARDGDWTADRIGRLDRLAAQIDGFLVDRIAERMHPPKWAVYLVLAENDWGDFYLPCLGRRERKHGHTEPWWDRRFDARNPFHWPYALLTALTGWVVMVEAQ